MLYQWKHGNTLAEYGLFIGLFVVFCVSSLTLLGHSINDLFSQTGSSVERSDMLGLPGVNAAAKPTNDTAMSVPAVGGPSSSAAVAGMPGNGLVNGLSPVAVNVSSVDGAGVVLASADTLQRIAKQIQDDPNHDPAILAVVTDLANSGHRAGSNIASGLESYKSVTNTASTIMSPQITNAELATSAFQSASKQFSDYIQAHPGALSPQMVTEVQGATKDAQGVMGLLFQPDSVGDNGTNGSAWIEMAQQTSSTVHQDSNTICQNGGDTNSCVK